MGSLWNEKRRCDRTTGRWRPWTPRNERNASRRTEFRLSLMANPSGRWPVVNEEGDGFSGASFAPCSCRSAAFTIATYLCAPVTRWIDRDGNLRLVAIGRCTPSWLKVSTGAEVMNLLLTSERVFADMIDWLQFGEPEQVVLRAFDPELAQEFEFRTFVHNGVLTAISQYDHYTVYPCLQDLKPLIQTSIQKAWREIHPHVGEQSYVADFAFSPTSHTAKLIELSPFLEVRRSRGSSRV